MIAATVSALRPDLAVISDWIAPKSRVLDLGCGDGALLAHLQKTREVGGYGLEIDSANVVRCIDSGVNVIQADVDAGLRGFESDSFDYVVMTQTLQALQRPDQVVGEMLRVGKTAIVTFPNFGHWRVRLGLLAGRMPNTPALPEEWYDTPNIHLCTVADFDDLCRERRWTVLKRSLLHHERRDDGVIRLSPNLFAENALYMLQR
ncbi:MAG TPA: methionine biosynthesis protein MetW [Nevskiaceae bacterium]|nr:methionine biosynthesis protein MetW [Nevskiaceae bacterium]